MKPRFLPPLVCLMLLVASNADSQVTLQIGAGAGVRLPMGDYSGETTDYYAGTKYGLSTGYSFQAKARVGLPGFTLVGGVEYGHLSNSGDAEASGQGKVEVAQSILTVKAGPEITIPLPGAPLTPYVGANVAWHSISGTTTFNGVSRVPSGSFDIETASRIGFGINAGVIIKLGPMMNLDLGAEYAFINPISKEWKVTATSTNRVDSYKSLNDEKDPLYAAGNTDHFVSAARSISSLQVMATLMIGL
jgi:outer membrane autotransporter protein